MPADGECYTSTCSVIALVGAAAACPFLEELGGQAVFDWCLALATIWTLILLAPGCVWLPQRRQHLQHHAPGTGAVPEDDLARDMTRYLGMRSSNKIPSFCSRACGKGSKAKD